MTGPLRYLDSDATNRRWQQNKRCEQVMSTYKFSDAVRVHHGIFSA